MVYENCKKIILAGFDSNPFMTKELMELQVEMFKVAGSIKLEQYNELIELLNPQKEEVIESLVDEEIL